MRWVFVFIIFLNLFFYVWQHQQETEKPITYSQSTNDIEANTPSIALLSEKPIPSNSSTSSNPLEPKEIAHRLDHQIAPPTKKSLPAFTCLYMGGVTNKKQLSIFLPYLKKIIADTKLAEVELKTPPRLHLYLAVDDRAEQTRILAKLKTANINALVINKRYLKGQISLGNFINKEDIFTLHGALNKLQLKEQIEYLPDAATSYWLKIPVSKQNLFTPDLLLEISKKFPTLQQELMRCNLKTL